MEFIYKVINNINGKHYIGLTSRTLKIRKKEHIKEAKNNTKFSIFHKALIKHGIENFTWEVIEECNTNKLEKREIYYIKKYNSYAPNKNGYNLTEGGLCKFGASGDNHWLNRMSKEDREKWLKENRHGENNGMYENGHVVSGENHFSAKMTKLEKENWLKNITGDNNYKKNMTEKELKNKCWMNNVSKEKKQNYINKHLKGKNNPFYKNTKFYIITFPNNEEYKIKINDFCKEYIEEKLYATGLYACANNKYSHYKGFKCRKITSDDEKILEWKL